MGTQGTTVNDTKLGPQGWNGNRGVHSDPCESLTPWFLSESLRWMFYPETLNTIEQARGARPPGRRRAYAMTAPSPGHVSL